MHIQLRFDTAEAEWYGELRACPTMPTHRVVGPVAHNVPISVIVNNLKRHVPDVEIAIEHDSLIAYRLFKAMQYMGDIK